MYSLIYYAQIYIFIIQQLRKSSSCPKFAFRSLDKWPFVRSLLSEVFIFGLSFEVCFQKCLVSASRSNFAFRSCAC